MASGDSMEIRYRAASASSPPTIVYSSSPSLSMTRTHDPIVTVPMSLTGDHPLYVECARGDRKRNPHSHVVRSVSSRSRRMRKPHLPSDEQGRDWARQVAT